MAQLIIFGGGDAGGLLIGTKGVRPIPPFDPNIRLQLRGLSALLNGSDPVPQKSAREMATLMNKLSNLIFSKVEDIIGPLEGDNSLIYQDDDGGFYCGSSGKAPVPFKWPPRIYPDVNELIAAGVLEKELIDFINEAANQKMDILKVLEEPAKVATKLGINLSEKTVKDLQRVAPSQLNTISNPIDREVIHFFHSVAKDGRFLSTWATQPYHVADQLNLKISDEAVEQILTARAGQTSSACGRGCFLVIAHFICWIVVIIAIVVSKDESIYISDSSGLKKF